VDGIDLRDLVPSDWQRQIGVIFQDFARYSLTARENVGFGQLNYVEDMSRIRSAGDLSGASDCIERLEHRWETVLGKVFDEAQDLSVGEWQKVALARAFLREAQILVLDEPTASLDAKQEYEIFAKFNEVTRGKMTILISHRFSTVRKVDRIFVIERGRLIETGSHDELMTLNNRYAELFSRQASAYH
jgi:ATP-binding cassette subfamily B protein